MPRYENKKMKRVDSVFYTERLTAEYDLSSVRLLANGVDTIRQLFICDLKLDVLEMIYDHYENKKGDVFEINGFEFKLLSGGKSAGYKFILKNLDLGLVILLKSQYCESDKRGSHIKVECTPQIIQALGLAKLSDHIRRFASLFADTLEASGVAVHLFCDVKGADIPDNFETLLHCHSRRNFKVTGISDANFNPAEASFVYGTNETYLFGRSNALQFCLYDKTKEALKSDKLEFMQSLWRQVPSIEDPSAPEYKDGSDGNEPDQVKRFEFRFHHSVIKEFEHGHFNATQKLDPDGNLLASGELIQIREARDLIKHLSGLWRYALSSYRLHHSTSYIHPLWQLLEDDVTWFGFYEGMTYKRSQKKSIDGPTKRNIAMFIGNYIRVAASRNFTVQFVTSFFLSSGLDNELCQYFGCRQFGDAKEMRVLLENFVLERMRDHKLNGVGV